MASATSVLMAEAVLWHCFDVALIIQKAKNWIVQWAPMKHAAWGDENAEEDEYHGVQENNQ
jgi:hypothetical protein